MTTDVDAIVNNWYHDLNTNERFLVVATDEINELLEVQNSEGDIEELTFQEWQNKEVELIEEPEEWLEAVESYDEDEYADDDDDEDEEWEDPDLSDSY